MREEYSSIYWVFAIIQVANYEHMYWKRRKRKTLSFFLARKNCEKTTKTTEKRYLSGTKTDFFTVFFWHFTILAKTSIFDLGLSLRAEFRFWPSKRFWQRIFGVHRFWGCTDFDGGFLGVHRFWRRSPAYTFSFAPIWFADVFLKKPLGLIDEWVFVNLIANI